MQTSGFTSFKSDRKDSCIASEITINSAPPHSHSLHYMSTGPRLENGNQEGTSRAFSGVKMSSSGNPRSSASCATADGISFLPLFLAAGGCVTTAATWNPESGEPDAASSVSRTEAAT